MNLQEAYETLKLSPSSSQEDVKKQYKKLTIEFHPDINKSPNAEDTFKKINEAFSTISNKDNQPHFENPFQHFHEPEHISISTTISFKESVLGAKKQISYQRKIKCQSCNGQGQSVSNDCKTCNGKGKNVSRNGNSIFVQTCQACQGKMNHTPCSPCNSSGIIQVQTNIDVTIPKFITNNSMLRLANMGNFFSGNNFFSAFNLDQYTDVHLTISVTPDPNLSLVDNFVVFTLPISLKDAVCGTSTKIPTLNSPAGITIPPLSKHKDTIQISSIQKVILNVEYPENIKSLLDQHKDNNELLGL